MHTQGKWTVQPGRCNGDYFITSDTSIVKPEETEANVRLIAASPIMYNYIKEKVSSGDKHAIKIISEIRS